MQCKHFEKREIPVDIHEEVRRRSRREIILKIRYSNHRRRQARLRAGTSSSGSDDDDTYSNYLDTSDLDLKKSESDIFLQPFSVKHRRSLLYASGIQRIDPSEKKECRSIRESRERSGCKCVGACLPGSCSCIRLGVNCHVDRTSFPCGCNSQDCQNENGRTEFDIQHVRTHLIETLSKLGLEGNLSKSQKLFHRSSLKRLCNEKSGSTDKFLATEEQNVEEPKQVKVINLPPMNVADESKNHPVKILNLPPKNCGDNNHEINIIDLQNHLCSNNYLHTFKQTHPE